MRRRTAIVPALVLALAFALAVANAASGQNAPEAKPPAAAPKAVSAADYPNGLVHTVVEGDTLWDLAAKYRGSPWKWPELWELNRFLTNPHYIYPGIRIVIYPPPEKDYAFQGKPAPPPEPSAAPAPPEPAAPPPSPVAAPPPGPPMLDIEPLDYVCGGEFLREKPVGIGRIAGAREPKIALSESDLVFLALSKEIPAGQLLAVYRVRGPIDDPGNNRITGYVKYLVGILQSTGKIDGQASARVRTSFEDLTKEDIVSEEIPAYAPVVINPGAKGLEAVVITGRSEKVELSTGDFIYLDKGSSAGVAVGNVFRVIDGRMELSGTDDAESSVRIEVARTVVIRTSADFATAYIVNSLQSFGAGVTVRRGVETNP